jgi:hypothetical protein
MIRPFAVMLPSISPSTSTEPEEVISPVILRSAPRTERAELLPSGRGREREGGSGRVGGLGEHRESPWAGVAQIRRG